MKPVSKDCFATLKNILKKKQLFWAVYLLNLWEKTVPTHIKCIIRWYIHEKCFFYSMTQKKKGKILWHILSFVKELQTFRNKIVFQSYVNMRKIERNISTNFTFANRYTDILLFLKIYPNLRFLKIFKDKSVPRNKKVENHCNIIYSESRLMLSLVMLSAA